MKRFYVMAVAACSLTVSNIQAQTHLDVVPHGNHAHVVPHTTYIPHTTTHNHYSLHGNHVDVIPHTTTHYHPGTITPRFYPSTPSYYPSTPSYYPSTSMGTTYQPIIQNSVIPAFQGVGMMLVNPSTNSSPIQVMFDSTAVTLPPGQMIRMKSKPSYSVQFDRGDGTQKSYSLADAKMYKFVIDGNAWDLKEALADSSTTTTSNSSPAIQGVPESQPASSDVAPAAISKGFTKGDMVQASIDGAEIRNGKTVLKRVDRGSQFQVMEVRDGNWVMVDFGGEEFGWMKSSQLVRVANAEDDAPPSVKK